MALIYDHRFKSSKLIIISPSFSVTTGGNLNERDDPYWTSRKNSLELIELSIRDDPYWTSRKNSLELMELSTINKVSLV
jgi:hypothetical protein